MVCDINIISVGQKTPLPVQTENGLVLLNEKDFDCAKRYIRICPFFSRINGTYYGIFRYSGEGMYTTNDILDSDFSSMKIKPLLSWISEKRCKDMTPIICKDYATCVAIENLLSMLLKASPIHMIAFQARYQGYDKETILGPIAYKQFCKMLQHNDLRFNTCYIVNIAP